MCRFAWLVMSASLAFLPLAAQEQEEEGAEAKPEEKAEVKEEEKAERPVKPSEVDVDETVRVLREIAKRAREAGDVERAERIEERAKAIEEGRVKPQVRGRRGQRGRGREKKEGEKEGEEEPKAEAEWVKRARENRTRMVKERQELVDTIDRQNQQIKELRRKTERLEQELEAVKALLKRLAAE